MVLSRQHLPAVDRYPLRVFNWPLRCWMGFYPVKVLNRELQYHVRHAIGGHYLPGEYRRYDECQKRLDRSPGADHRITLLSRIRRFQGRIDHRELFCSGVADKNKTPPRSACMLFNLLMIPDTDSKVNPALRLHLGGEIVG